MKERFSKWRTRKCHKCLISTTMKFDRIKQNKSNSFIHLLNISLLIFAFTLFSLNIGVSCLEQTDCDDPLLLLSPSSRDEPSERYIDRSLASDNQSLSLLDYSAINFSDDDDIIIEQQTQSSEAKQSAPESDYPTSGSSSSRNLWRRQVFGDGSVELFGPNSLTLDYDSYRLPVANFDTPTPEAYTRRFTSASDISSPSLSASASATASSSASTLPNSQISASLKDSSGQYQQKSGPQFIKEPPSFIHYLNSSDLVIPCSASGNPQPTISWWHKSSQLEVGSLLDKRYVRYDNSLVISAFKAVDFEPDIHSTTYKCQASNSLGTIVSRDIVINAVIDQDYEQEVTVADQFVSVDNDAVFKCQLAPQARDLFQVVGWIEDGQHLIQHVSQPALVWWLNVQQNSMGLRANQLIQQQQQRTLVLPDGQLYIQRVQLKDTNKSFRCQIKNLLDGQISLSSLSGRLFVTDINEQSGTSPRIVDSPKPVSVVKLGEQLLLSCIAQGSPRPNIRWFRQKNNSLQQQDSSLNEWLEIQQTNNGTTTSSPSSSATTTTTTTTMTQANESKYVISHEGNLLLIKSLQIADNKLKFKCLANNSFGVHFSETEIRLDIYPTSKLVEVEPKLEHINSIDLTPQSMVFNCTIRASSSPLISIEWLKNGKHLFSISSALFVSQSSISNLNNHFLDGFDLPSQHQYQITAANVTSMFDDLNQELSAIEYNQASTSLASQIINGNEQLLDFGLNQQQQSQDASSSFSGPFSSASASSSGSGSRVSQSATNFMLTSTTLNKLSRYNDNDFLPSSSNNGDEPLIGTTSHQHLKQKQEHLKQRLKLINKDTMLYQLYVDQVERSDRGSYQCRARNLRTTFHATSQLMLKDNPPQFVETFSSQLLTKSHLPQVSLKCIASGSPLPEISWTLSGFPIPESNRFRVGDYVTRDGLIVSFVNISNVQVEDGGLFECSATNDVGQLKHSAWLNVTGQPFIRSMPNISAIAGHSISIMCPVGGWPIEQISWFQNSTKLPLNHRQKLFPNGTLLISELNEVTDSGQYSCQAKSSSQGNGQDMVAVNHINIFIRVPPVVEPFSFAKSLHRGQRYNIMCTVVRGDLPVSIRWSKDGRPIESAPVESNGIGFVSGNGMQQAINEQQQQQQQQQQQLQHQVLQEQVPQTTALNNNNPNNNMAGIAIKHLDPYSSTLTFASLQSYHRGVYTCDAANEAGQANQSSSLVIHVPPEWRIEPKDMSVTVGKTAVIDCQADAFPAARIEWRLSQDLFREPPTEFKPIISSLYMRVFENGSLIIYNTQRTDAGYYLCQANNGVGPGLSRVIKLTVHVAAHFKTKIKTDLVRRGQSARLKCEAIGDLPIEINWLRDKMPLYPSDESRYSISKTLLQDGIVSELNIIETDRQDSALFTCITQNSYGNDDTNIQLLVQAPPDQPLDIRIHEYEARSVRISWLPAYSGNSPIVKYIIMHAQTSQTNPEVSANLISEQQQQQVDSKRLMAPTLAINQYVNVSVSGNESSILLQNLTPLTEYQFYMFAVNSIGTSRMPNEPIKFRTDDEAPSGPPLFVKATPTSSRSIRIKWRVPERRAHYGSISGFYVGYKQHNKHQTSSSSSNGNTNEQTPRDTFIYKTVEFNYLSNNQQEKNSSNLELDCTLLALRKGQKYLITVQAFNSRGAGPASEPIVVETWKIDVPDPPTLRMLMRTTRSIHIAWRLSTTSGQLANSNLITGSSNSADSIQANLGSIQQAALKMRKNMHDHMKNLKKFDTVVNEHNSYDLSEPKKILTAGGDSSRYSSSKDYDNSDNSDEALDLAQANEPILGFILTRKQVPQTQVQLSNNNNNNNELDGPPVEIRLPSDHLSHIVDNLTCGTKYQFTIVALNSVGASQSSDPLMVKTEGSTPVAPDKASLLSLNSSSLLINLAAWHNGACAMRSFDIMFKASRSKNWQPLTNYQVSPSTPPYQEPQKVVSGAIGNSSNNELSLNGNQQLVQRSPLSQHQQQQVNANSTIVLEDLSSTINYDLKIIATNEAGWTEALYTFNTKGGSLSLNRGEDQQWASGGEFQFSDTNLSEFFSSSNPMLIWFLFLLFISLTFSTGYIVIAKRRHASSSSCSLSLSSASRSNQSTSNYYTSSNVGNQLESSSLVATKGSNVNSTLRCNTLGLPNGQKLRLAAAPANDHRDPDHLAELLASGQNHDDQNVMQLNNIYGQHQHQQQQQQLQAQLNVAGVAEKSNYAYLSHQLRPSSPHNTDMSTVINGSEAEMCLGASALNIALQSQQEQSQSQSQTQSQSQSQEQQQQLSKQQRDQNGYYITPSNLLTFNGSGKPATGSSQQMNINKSSTLPTNCHQQILQHLMQQQQQQQSESEQNQQMIDSLLAANILQQQQQLQCSQEAAYLTLQQAASQDSNQQNINALLEQQVYATVKRGCPRPPRLCDYTIYQCPNNQDQQQPPDQQQQQLSILRCCAELQVEPSAPNTTHQQSHVCYHPNLDPQQQSCLQQQQQQHQSDYQQLRPIN